MSLVYKRVRSYNPLAILICIHICIYMCLSFSYFKINDMFINTNHTTDHIHTYTHIHTQIKFN